MNTEKNPLVAIEQNAQELVYAAQNAQKNDENKETMIRIMHDRFDSLETLMLEI
jgi:hypothetical protein